MLCSYQVLDYSSNAAWVFFSGNTASYELEALEAKWFRNFSLHLVHKQALRILEQEKHRGGGHRHIDEGEKNGRHHHPPLVERPSCRTASYHPAGLCDEKLVAPSHCCSSW